MKDKKNNNPNVVLRDNLTTLEFLVDGDMEHRVLPNNDLETLYRANKSSTKEEESSEPTIYIDQRNTDVNPATPSDDDMESKLLRTDSKSSLMSDNSSPKISKSNNLIKPIDSFESTATGGSESQSTFSDDTLSSLTSIQEEFVEQIVGETNPKYSLYRKIFSDYLAKDQYEKNPLRAYAFWRALGNGYTLSFEDALAILYHINDGTIKQKLSVQCGEVLRSGHINLKVVQTLIDSFKASKAYKSEIKKDGMVGHGRNPGPLVSLIHFLQTHTFFAPDALANINGFARILYFEPAAAAVKKYLKQKKVLEKPQDEKHVGINDDTQAVKKLKHAIAQISREKYKSDKDTEELLNKLAEIMLSYFKDAVTTAANHPGMISGAMKTIVRKQMQVFIKMFLFGDEKKPTKNEFVNVGNSYYFIAKVQDIKAEEKRIAEIEAGYHKEVAAIEEGYKNERKELLSDGVSKESKLNQLREQVDNQIKALVESNTKLALMKIEDMSPNDEPWYALIKVSANDDNLFESFDAASKSRLQIKSIVNHQEKYYFIFNCTAKLASSEEKNTGEEIVAVLVYPEEGGKPVLQEVKDALCVEEIKKQAQYKYIYPAIEYDEKIIPSPLMIALGEFLNHRAMSAVMAKFAAEIKHELIKKWSGKKGKFNPQAEAYAETVQNNFWNILNAVFVNLMMRVVSFLPENLDQHYPVMRCSQKECMTKLTENSIGHNFITYFILDKHLLGNLTLQNKLFGSEIAFLNDQKKDSTKLAKDKEIEEPDVNEVAGHHYDLLKVICGKNDKDIDEKFLKVAMADMLINNYPVEAVMEDFFNKKIPADNFFTTPIKYIQSKNGKYYNLIQLAYITQSKDFFEYFIKKLLSGKKHISFEKGKIKEQLSSITVYSDSINEFYTDWFPKKFGLMVAVSPNASRDRNMTITDSSSGYYDSNCSTEEDEISVNEGKNQDDILAEKQIRQEAFIGKPPKDSPTCSIQ